MELTDHVEPSICHFVFFDGPYAGTAETFENARIAVGRATSCDLRLDASSESGLENNHVEILEEDGEYFLHDLSKGNTLVNGQKVHGKCLLESEDYIRFGETGPELIFRIGKPAEGQQPIPNNTPEVAELTFLAGNDNGRTFPVSTTNVTRIGRRSELEIPLDPRGDMIVSGNHCSISFEDGSFILTDTSRNGTYVNNELVDSSVAINDGDVVMLGDGGPQARFRVRLIGMNYPNQRVLSGRSSRVPVAAPAPVIPQVAPVVAAPIAPTPAESAPLFSDEDPSSAPEAMPGEILDSGQSGESEIDGIPTAAGLAGLAVAATSAAPASGAAAGAGVAAMELDDDTTTGRGGNPTPIGRSLAPARRGRNLKPLWIALAALVLIVGAVAIFSGGDDEDDLASRAGSTQPQVPLATPASYSKAIGTPRDVANVAGKFSVKVPEGWEVLNEGGGISVESPDKFLAIDFLRDPRLTPDSVKNLAESTGGAADSITSDSISATWIANASGVTRIAVLHYGVDGDFPLLALMEGTDQAVAALSEDDVSALLLDNVAMDRIAPKVEPTVAVTPRATAAPTPQPTAAPTPEATPELPAPDTELPAPAITPSPVATSTPAETPEATPQATVTPDVTPAATESAAGETTTAAADNLGRVSSRALDLTLNLPATWTGNSEEAEAVIFMSDGTGLDVRLARDPGTMDETAIFEAMTADGWKREDLQRGNGFSGAEFSRTNERLLLVLVPEPDSKSTLVLYCTNAKSFTKEQRAGIIQIVQQVRAGR